MEWLIAVLVAAGSLGVLRFLVKRAGTIAKLAIEDGTVRIVGGGIPPAILNDLRDVVSDPPVRSAHVRIVRAARYAEVQIDGEMSPGQVQRIRNVVGSIPLARLASARRA